MSELRSSEFKLTFILASALLAMHSIYIGQLLWPAAAPLIVHMCVLLGGVAIVYDYPHPAKIKNNMYKISLLNFTTYSGIDFEIFK